MLSEPQSRHHCILVDKIYPILSCWLSCCTNHGDVIVTWVNWPVIIYYRHLLMSCSLTKMTWYWWHAFSTAYQLSLLDTEKKKVLGPGLYSVLAAFNITHDISIYFIIKNQTGPLVRYLFFSIHIVRILQQPRFRCLSGSI